MDRAGGIPQAGQLPHLADAGKANSESRAADWPEPNGLARSSGPRRGVRTPSTVVLLVGRPSGR
jgi:hypothetical protein